MTFVFECRADCCEWYEQLEDDSVERRTILRREENRYLIERTVKHGQVYLLSIFRALQFWGNTAEVKPP